MNIILLSGGSGKRLWPLSNEVRSKQFLKIFKTEDGNHESMVQRMYRMIKDVDHEANITIATSQNQVSQIKAQLGEKVGISIEPSRRDTFPAIVLAAAFLKKEGVEDGESVIVCPVDPYVEKDYFESIKELDSICGNANLTLLGIEPTYPSEKYGYIIPKSKDQIANVKEFKEKPSIKEAEQYIKDGALWNGGIFAFSLSYMLNIAKETLGTDDYDALYKSYDSLQKISFDYAVAEKEQDIRVLRFHGQWKDLGTWNTLTEAMEEEIGGNSKAIQCSNTHVINELSIPLIAIGIDNTVIAATPDGILVSDKEMSTQLKDYVEAQRPMYERREWGEYKVLNYKIHEDGNNSLVKELVISPGKHISYQRHKKRTEMWTFTDGDGELIIDGEITRVSRGDTVVIPPLTKHAIKAINELHIIEVQMGDELTEEDIERLDWKW